MEARDDDGWVDCDCSGALSSLFRGLKASSSASRYFRAAMFFEWHLGWSVEPSWLRVLVLSMAFIPAYLLFSLSLIVLSAAVTKALDWRTPDDAELPIRELSWPLLNWVRGTIASQLVRIFAGPLFRSTPVWTFYLRLNGAKLGATGFHQ